MNVKVDDVYDLLGCDTEWFGKRVQMCRRILLRPCSG
jgi:hypothetical protein